jgi:hypothetical protein
MLILRLKTFFKSLFFHIKSGLPKANQSEIIYRYNICLSCEEFDSIKSQCSVCGCNVNKKSQFLNKLAWADQECPQGKWQKIIR